MLVVLTVIFGAGASFDSIPPDPRTTSLTTPRAERQKWRAHERNYRPPLGSQLFEPRPFFDSVIAEYRSIALLAEQLRNLPTTVALETRLDQLREASLTDPTLRRELAGIRFYLKRVLWEASTRWADYSPGKTNYHQLLRQLKQWRDRVDEEVMLITFNYDLLLEHAIRDSIGGFDLTTIDGYVRRSDFKALQPHGSVNWVRYVSADIQTSFGRLQRDVEQDVIDLAGLRTDLPLERYEIVPDLKTFARGGRALFPLMTLPVQTKSLELPPSQESELRRALSKCSRVLIIGWRATELHFLELWKAVRKTSPLVLVVSSNGDRAGRTLDTLEPVLSPADGLASVVSGFTEFMRSNELEDFLSL